MNHPPARTGPRSRLFFCSVLLVLAGLHASGPARAAEYRVGEAQVHVGADEVIDDDLVAQGERIVIEGRVNGDLVASGQQIEMRGHVKGDFIAAARDLTLDGRVADDVRVAAYALEVGPNARVGDDAFSAAFSTQARSGSRISGSWHLVGYQAQLAGRIGEHLLGGANAFELAGKVKGDARVEASASGERPDLIFSWVPTTLDLPRLDPGLAIRGDAVIGGDLAYRSEREAEIDSDADLRGEVSFDARSPGDERGDAPKDGVKWSLHLRRLVTLSAVAALLFWLAPTFVPALWSRARRDPLRSLGWGAGISLAVGVAAVVIAALTALAAGIVGGLTLGGLAPPLVATGALLELAILTPFLSVAAYLPPVVAAWGAGTWILARWRPEWLEGSWRAVATGALAYVAVVALPGLGGAVAWAVAIVGVGALALQVADPGAPDEPLQPDGADHAMEPAAG